MSTEKSLVGAGVNPILAGALADIVDRIDRLRTLFLSGKVVLLPTIDNTIIDSLKVSLPDYIKWVAVDYHGCVLGFKRKPELGRNAFGDYTWCTYDRPIPCKPYCAVEFWKSSLVNLREDEEK